jgi:NADH-quinone oxidoreductase subunit L
VLSGIAGKSGQFPFHDWLPDAMEGPTPASALIHAATMVAAGTFVLARLFPIFALSDPARLLLAVLTAMTMIGAAILAFGQSDLKRLLAYSTLSQIAIMLSAIAVAPAAEGPEAGILHLMSHAMFKALLFLAIGWLSVLVAGTSALAMSGGVRRHKQLAIPLGIGLLSLAGVPPLVGFVSKEYVLGAALDSSEAGSAAGWIVLIAVGVTALLTAAYCTRAWLVLNHRVEPQASRAKAGAHAQPGHGHAGIHVSARLSIWLLAVLSVFGGLIIFTPLVVVEPHINYYLVGASVLLILVAVVAVRAVAQGQTSGDAAERLGAERMVMFDQGYGADGVYVAVANRVVQLAWVVVLLDRQVIDAYVRGTVVATRWAGFASEKAHTRKPSSYLVWLLVGLLAVGMTGVTLW